MNIQIGFTALMYATQRGHLEMATLLADNGADLEARNNVSSSSPHELHLPFIPSILPPPPLHLFDQTLYRVHPPFLFPSLNNHLLYQFIDYFI